MMCKRICRHGGAEVLRFEAMGVIAHQTDYTLAAVERAIGLSSSILASAPVAAFA